MGIAHHVDCECKTCYPTEHRATTYPPEDFRARAAELARAAGWSAPNGGLFISGDLQSLWSTAVQRNRANPIAALEAFACFQPRPTTPDAQEHQTP